MTIEAAIARSSGLSVREQIITARNLALWGTAVLGLAAGALLPEALSDPSSAFTALEGLAAIPALIVARRAWRLHNEVRALDEEDEPDLVEGDEEVAQLEALVGSLDSKSAIRAGRQAIAAAKRAYIERRRILDRRTQIEVLWGETVTPEADTALAAEVAVCDSQVTEIDAQVGRLIASVAHLVQAADHRQERAITEVREAADAVTALAAAMEELEAQSRNTPLEG